MKFKSAALIILAAVLAGGYWLYSKAVNNTIPPCNFTFAKDTTVITEPKDELGYPDYESALNTALRKNIKPEDNANVLFWQAFGPTPEGGKPLHKDYFDWLGAECPKASGIKFEHYFYYLKQKGFDPEDDEFKTRDKAVNNAPWKATDYPEFAEWLKAQEPSLTVVVRASKKHEYYNPIIARTDNGDRRVLISSLLPIPQKNRETADALIKRANLHLGEGRTQEAWDDILTTYRTARLLSKGGCLIEYLVALAIDAIAIKETQLLLEHAKLTSQQIARIRSDIEGLKPLAPLDEKVDLAERFNMLDLVTATRKYGVGTLERIDNARKMERKDNPPHQAVLDSLNFDVVLRTVNHYYDDAVKVSRISRYGDRKKAWGDWEIQMRERSSSVGNFADLKPVLQEDGKLNDEIAERYGHILAVKMMPAVQKVQAAHDRNIQFHRNLDVTFALAAYRADNKKYPASLNELSPKYIKAVPLDYFTDKPLIYKPDDKGYLLYSVGVNCEDDDGATFGEDPPGDDIVVRVPHRIP